MNSKISVRIIEVLLYSQISISRSCWDSFYKFNSPEVQINLHLRKICTSGNSDFLKESPQPRFDPRKLFLIEIDEILYDFEVLRYPV